MSNLDFDRLWIECEALYPANKNACLKLQDEHDVNVNLLLLALYLDKYTELRYSQTQWLQLINSIEDWESSTLKPFRKSRRLAKNTVEKNKYQQMLTEELVMERESQKLINNVLASMHTTTQDSNYRNYMSCFKCTTQQTFKY